MNLESKKVKRYSSVIGIKKEKLKYYKQLHANPWKEVMDVLKNCNIHNYSIFLRQMDDGNHYLFSYFEYTGEDFNADIKTISKNKMIKKWWKETDPCQSPLAGEKSWAEMEEVFHSE